MLQAGIQRLTAAYKRRVYPRVTDVRGAWFLGHHLERLCLRRHDTIDTEPTGIFENGRWDNLLLLDACRHDVYEEVNGPTGTRVTVGSCTPEFVRKTFSDRDCSDTVYVSANPHLHGSRFENKTGKRPEAVFADVYDLYLTHWDEEAGTVLPDDVSAVALQAADEHPEKRLIVHFMQPHVPFLSISDERAAELDLTNTDADERGGIAEKAERGMIPRDEYRRLYRENLEIAMEQVERLVDALDGTTVITSDHGELLGEGGRYLHPCRMPHQVLRTVPWDER